MGGANDAARERAGAARRHLRNGWFLR